MTATPAFVQETIQPEQPDKARFVDVADNAWYAESVYYVADKGMMNGIGENKFAPTATTTRGMLMTILARYAGQDTTVSSYAVNAMQWATANGIVNGANNQLNPKGNATRAEMAAILMRFCEKNK